MQCLPTVRPVLRMSLTNCKTRLILANFEGDPTACIETEHDSSTDESDVQEDFFDERGEEFEVDYEQDSAQ